MTNHDDEPTTKVAVPTDAVLLAERRAVLAVDMAARRIAMDADRLRAVLEMPKRTRGDEHGT